MNPWRLVQVFENYVDFDKEVLACDDEGYTTLDVRLTFDREQRVAYMVVAWHNNNGNTVDLEGDRGIDWDAALRLIEADVAPEILESLK